MSLIENTVPAATKRLTSLARAKVMLGIAADDTSDDLRLQMLIDYASAAAIEHCGREFALATWRETITCTGPRMRLMLTHTPLKTVTTVEYKQPGATVWTGLTAFEIEDDRAGFIRFTDGTLFWRDTQYRVTYQAGYEPLTDMPHGIEMGTIEILKGLWFTTGDAVRDPFIRQESIPDVASFSYGGSAGVGLPESAIAHLEPFRRVSLA